MINKNKNELIKELEKHGAFKPDSDYFAKLFEKSNYFKNKEIDLFIEDMKKNEPHLFKSSLTLKQAKLYNKGNNIELKREMLKKLWGFK